MSNKAKDQNLFIPPSDDIELLREREEEEDEDMEDFNAMTELGTTLIQAILEMEPLENIQDLIDADAPLWFQDNEGTSPLHAAAYVQDPELVKLLIEEGAVWNAGKSSSVLFSLSVLDNLGNTAGDIALSLNNEACYTLIRDAGIRAALAELLLALLSSRSSLTQTPSSLVIRNDDTSAMASTDAFLASRLQYTKDTRGQEICLLKLKNGIEVGVMMGWEQEIMRKTVDELCSSHPRLEGGLKVLNVGFGLGIIDGMFQALSKPPSLHVIIEPHPDVLAHMEEQGWHEKQGVKIMKGKWQDILSSQEFLDLGKFDVVYTDTFAENYDELHKFFKSLPDLLDGPDARFSFFNGLAATRADVRWSDVEVGVNSQEDEERWGETRKYFTQPIYRLPIAQLKQKE
ncbi:hypothetical protein HYDPIDRAFT_169751 [Hydnomerulius pinastri MD-312]|uniref:Arginine N-methyltransferase 2 n=1 Tax=Hydnomerulius pinastri MD-312 TaxID=994086 RepID=A0A0C9V6Q8_9AGAM|nr:hypothetical protein HYDPIDRAFT_169751 [Hydnomerulius pinastri MD-312]